VSSFVVVLLFPALGLVPMVAWADGGTKGGDAPAASASATSGKKHDPNNIKAISEFMETCVAGNAKYASRDFQGATDLYRKAIQLDPNHALGHYLLGEAFLAQGNIPEADAAWQRAANLSNEKNPALRARVLFVVADLKERQKKWDDARSAWQVYLDWASKYADAGAFPGSATSRQQAIDTMTKQDKAYDVVRQRIADTKDGGVFTDLSKSAPASSH
jgi:tetratricopeptide (TPR) repeat protein